MARDRRTRKIATEEATPTQPSWRRPPARPRKELRKMQSSTPRVNKPASRRASPAPGLRLPSLAAVKEIARGLLMVALVGGLTFGMVQLLRLPQLAVTSTSTLVGGALRISPGTVYEASGLEGRNIFLVRSAEVAAAIGQIPGIEGVRVHVRLPNQVLIDVWEHTPLVAWRGITTTLWLAADGAPVPSAGQAPPLTLLDQSGISPDARDPLVQLLLQDLQALHAAQPDITEVYYDKTRGLSFRTAEGWDVWLGEGGYLANKLALLGAARQEIARQGGQASVIDLRHSAQRAIWR